MTAEFCPRCGLARVGAFRYCRSCSFDFEGATAGPTPVVPVNVGGQTSTATGWIGFVFAAIIAAGFVWIWANTGGSDFAVHVVFTVLFGLFWTAVVAAVGGILIGILGIGAALAFPFTRRRK